MELKNTVGKNISQNIPKREKTKQKKNFVSTGPSSTEQKCPKDLGLQ